MSRKQFFAPKRKQVLSCKRSSSEQAVSSASTKKDETPTNSDGLLKFVLKSRQEVFLIPSTINEEIEDGVRVVLALNERGAAVVIPWENIAYMEETTC